MEKRGRKKEKKGIKRTKEIKSGNRGRKKESEYKMKM